MKRQKMIKWITQSCILGLILIITFGCEKENNDENDEIIKTDVTITWNNPSDIYAGTELDSNQLNATANVEGTFIYSPASGTILDIGNNQTLTVNFTPTDTTKYNNATKSVSINVLNQVGIGDNHQGGIVAYIFQPGDPGYIIGQKHGLIVATSDPVSGIPWCSGDYVITGATGEDLGTGQSNTNTIISYQGSPETNYAAKLCDEYSAGGYNDWYLPSKEELNKIYLNKDHIGGFADSYYWTSTEHSSPYAWLQNFETGSQVEFIKGVSYKVRPIRTF